MAGKLTRETENYFWRVEIIHLFILGLISKV